MMNGNPHDHHHEVHDEIGKETLDSDDDEVENAEEKDNIEYKTMKLNFMVNTHPYTQEVVQSFLGIRIHKFH